MSADESVPAVNDPTSDASPRRDVRTRARWAGVGGFVLGLVVAGAVALALSGDDADPVADGGETVGTAVGSGAGEVATAVQPETPEPILSGPVRVLLVGDSIAAQIGWSLEIWNQENPGVISVFNEAHLGCGVVRYGRKRVADGSSGPVGDVCSDWAEPVALHTVADPEVVSWPAAIDLFDPDIVVATISSWDAVDRIVPGVAADWVAPGDPAYDTYVYENYLEAIDVLTAGGAHLHWLVSPYLDAPILHDDHRDRVDILNRLVVDAAAAMRDRDVSFLDYPAFIGEPGGPRDQRLRDDGVHLSEAGFAEVAPWLVSQLGLL